MVRPRDLLICFESLRTHFLQHCICSTLYPVLYNIIVSDIVTEKLKIHAAGIATMVRPREFSIFLKV